jgi:hypothetical protein
MRASNSVVGLFCLSCLASQTACGGGGDADGDGGPNAMGGTSSTAGSAGQSGAAGNSGAAGAPSGGTSSGSGGAAGKAGGGAGGMGGKAGTGGSGGGLPHIVEACTDGEGGELPRGVWDDVTPADVDLGTSGTLAFALDPTDSRIIYLGTIKRGIYKSSDCGASWLKLDTGENTTEMDKGNNNHMLVDPSDTNVLYATTGYGGPLGVFKSTNGGVDWAQVLSAEAMTAMYGGFMESVAMDPTNSQHIVVSPHGACSGNIAPGCVAETTDAGATWELLGGGVPTWVETQNLQLIDSDTWLIGQIFGDDTIWRTSDAGGSWHEVASKAGAAFYQEVGGTIYAAGPGGGLKSTDNGASWDNMPNSAISSVITGDGTNLYTGYGGYGHAYWTAPESDTSSWTNLESPDMAGGACLPSFTYDKDHRILYSTNCGSGFWRATIP